MAPYPRAIHDNRGAEVKPGCRVAYNLSGQIGVGIVKEVRASTRHGRRAPLILITPEHPEWAKRIAESKVRDALSVLVLDPPPGDGESALESLLEPQLEG